MLTTHITYFGQPCIVTCDVQCEKAWGIQCRPRINFDEDDDCVWLADGELGLAPTDPQTYEGGQGKPFKPTRHNKWCVRECERSDITDPGEPIDLHDWSQRLYNQPWKHGIPKKEPS